MGDTKPTNPLAVGPETAGPIDPVRKQEGQVNQTIRVETPQGRFERYALGFAQAMLTAKPGATPHSLAKQVLDFTEAFITALDSRGAK
jgi:hypothetical protein